MKEEVFMRGVYEMSVLKWVYRFRGYLVAPPLIFTLFWFHWEIEDYWVQPLGICLFLIGFFLRLWAQQHLHYRLKVHKDLTTTGPYGLIRNPLYIGNIIICMGLTVTSELLWLVPVTFFWCIVIYSFVIRYEEVHLLDKYGEDYRRYTEEVPRWLPKGLRLRNLDLMNEYLGQTIVVEIPCLLLLFPFTLKEMIDKSIN